jgi:formiminotetrahydrofolate cyclodeaminase
MQADIDAYTRVMDTYKMPKETETQQAARAAAIQDALKHASDVPMRVATLCAQVLDLTRVVAEKGNKNAASDGGVGALMAEAGLRGAAFNVSINLGSIKDEAYVREHRAQVAELVTRADQLKREILSVVESRM